MRTNVYLTIDTECTEERLVRGTVRPPVGFDLMVWARFKNQALPLGIEWIVAELEKFGQQATFFTETLSAEVFGRHGLSEVCSYLLRHGQDVQLHLHPNLRRPEWRQSGGQPLPDNISDYTATQQTDMLRQGVATLVECGVPRDAIVAFRAGNYGASNVTWNAMKNAGLLIDSSLNLCYVGRDCSIAWPTTPPDLFQPLPGVWELPVSVFRSGAGFRHLEITAISVLEMCRTLDKMHARGVQHAVIVLHPAEFFFIDSWERQTGRPNRINRGRFRRLLRFLHERRSDFHVDTLRSLAGRILAGEAVEHQGDAFIPSGSATFKWARTVTQAIKRLDARFGLL